jgi:hypothetical protein
MDDVHAPSETKFIFVSHPSSREEVIECLPADAKLLAS